MTAFVISDVLGQRAGAYIATSLLCRELTRAGLKVSCFAQHESGAKEEPCDTFDVVRPWLRKGCRWDWPGRCLARQAIRQIRRDPPDFAFVMGVTSLAGYLLRSDIANRLSILELTNANPGNKFIDSHASRLLSRCRAMISPSKVIDQNIRQTYGYQGSLLRLPFWIEDHERLQNPAPQKFLADFIYLGRRDKEKGIEELVRATAVVRDSFPSVRVLIAGAGSEKPFSSLASELDVAQNVVFQFFESRCETMEALARSRCLVLPSYHEGYPLVLLEALQHSVPFIATPVGSIPELYDSSRAALLVPARDDQALAGAMKLMLSESSDEYAGRRATAHELFQSLSSAGIVASRLRKVLRALEASS